MRAKLLFVSLWSFISVVLVLIWLKQHAFLSKSGSGDVEKELLLLDIERFVSGTIGWIGLLFGVISLALYLRIRSLESRLDSALQRLTQLDENRQ
jgi:hypothetical protein